MRACASACTKRAVAAAMSRLTVWASSISVVSSEERNPRHQSSVGGASEASSAARPCSPGNVERRIGQILGQDAAGRTYGFASRLLNGGDIGIAEAYLRGEWDTPDLTQFLYLFCVNHD
jgi:hypothetical protein